MKWFRSLTQKHQAILALIIANTIWGAASPIFKWSLGNIPLFTLAYFRFIFASIVLLPFVWKINLRLIKADVFKLVSIALFGITLNITFFFLGLQKAPSINAPIVASSGPILLVIASIFFLKEKPKRKILIGTFVSLVGVFVIILRPLLEKGFDFSAVLGNIYFVLATIGAVGHTVMSKELLNRYCALYVTFWTFLIGSISFFPFFIQETIQNFGILNLDIRGWTGLIFGIFLSSTVAYLLYEWAVGKVDASETGVFTYIDPVIATIIAIPLLGETITPLFMLGSIFVFGGIFIAESRLHWHPLHKLREKVI